MLDVNDGRLDAISAEAIKTTLRRRYPDLSHVTVEVAVCADCT